MAFFERATWLSIGAAERPTARRAAPRARRPLASPQARTRHIGAVPVPGARGGRVGSPAMPIGIITGSGTHALPGFADAELAVARDAVRDDRGVARALRGRRRPPRIPPRRRSCAAVTPGDPPGRHPGAARPGRDRGDRLHRLRRRGPEPGARLARRLRRPALRLQPAARRLAVHVLRRARRPGPRPLDPPRGAVLGRGPRGGAGRRRRGGPRRPRRRGLRPRRRAALQHPERDRPAGRAAGSSRSARPAAPRRCCAASSSCPSRWSASSPTTPTRSCRASRRRWRR